MKRWLPLFTLVGLMGAAYGLYHVKWEVWELKRNNAELKTQLEEEMQALDVLRAEWAYLNRPERLQELAQAHLTLTAGSGTQISDITTMPLPPIEDEPVMAGTTNNGTVLSSLRSQ